MNYAAALKDEMSPYHREARRLAQNIVDSAHSTVVDGVIRWRSNGSVPPADIVEFAVALGEAVSVEACDAARSADIKVFVAQMRANDRPATEEERADMRAAFGPGVEVVNVITGRRTRT